MKLRSGRIVERATPYVVPTRTEQQTDSHTPGQSGPKKRPTRPPRSEKIPQMVPVSSKSDLPLHDAVATNDAAAVRQLVSSGSRPIQLDSQRRSPLDLLDSMDIDAREQASMRSELLRSQNPTAPEGYVKPEAFHGSPWGLEILLSGELKGGVNDPKGGSQSLEGQVFFSDRTPATRESARTRADLRGKPRSYAKGATASPNSASARAAQHRSANVLLDAIAKSSPLGSGTSVTIRAGSETEAQQQFAEHLQSVLHLASASFGSPSAFANASPEQVAMSIRLPTSVTFDVQGQAAKTFTGSELTGLLRSAGEMVKETLEGGKAPFLSLINGGNAVPVVFGFEKVAGLKTHTVGTLSQTRHSYQSENHPLAGSERGGKLKEIEIQSLQDLATLCLGMLAKGAPVPSQVVIRLKPSGKLGPKATYLRPEQFQAVHARVLQESAKVFKVNPEQATNALGSAPIEQLQQLNAFLRTQPFDEPVGE